MTHTALILMLVLLAFIVGGGIIIARFFRHNGAHDAAHGAHAHAHDARHGFLLHSWWFWSALVGVETMTGLISPWLFGEEWRMATMFVVWLLLLFAWRFMMMVIPGKHVGADGEEHAGHGPQERDTGVEIANAVLGIIGLFLLDGWFIASEMTPMDLSDSFGNMLEVDYWEFVVTLSRAPGTFVVIWLLAYSHRFVKGLDTMYYVVTLAGYVTLACYVWGSFPFRAMWEQWPHPTNGFWTMVYVLFPPHF